MRGRLDRDTAANAELAQQTAQRLGVSRAGRMGLSWPVAVIARHHAFPGAPAPVSKAGNPAARSRPTMAIDAPAANGDGSVSSRGA